MTDTPELMPIGRFSSLTRISVRMLRHYDTHRVLVPAFVDPVTGYRRYGTSQLSDAAVIRRLRDVGFAVSAIGAMLAVRGTDAFDDALAAQRRELALAADDAAARLRLIDRLIDHQELTMTDTVELTSVPAATYALLRGTLSGYAAEGQLWQRFLPALHEQGIVPIGPGGTIEHDDEFRESDVDESVFLEVPPDTHAREPLEVMEVPSRTAVVATVVGPYAEAIPRAHELIGGYLAEHELQLSRTADDVTTHHFNVYLCDPNSTDEDRLRTAVHVPVRAR